MFANTDVSSTAPGTLARAKLKLLSATVACTLMAACGSDGNGPDRTVGGSGGSGSSSDWMAGSFMPAASFQAQCENPRSGTDANGNPWPDVQGKVLDENNFLRSYSDDTYLWYEEIVDRDPGLFDNPLAYFDVLKTDELAPSGNPKDNFHFTIDTDDWIAQSQSGIQSGYGAQFALIESAPPRQIVVAYTDPNTPATASGLVRGTEVLTIDGADAIDGNDVDTLNAGLFPESSGETHTFRVRDPDGTERNITMQSAEITSTPVQNVSVLPTPTGDVGYLVFNDHIATAEQLLIDAVTQLDADNITDLVVDLRYNGGGFLDLASQFAYMIAGPTQTGGRDFELQQFNDKYPSTNPVTGQSLQPVPFHTTTLGFSAAAGTALPTLDLSTVYVLTGSGTCSASEAIINGLRGAGVNVVQIGSTTCGKPYGFYPTDNCGTTYFTIQFRGVNDANFGDYAEGFSPANTIGTIGTSVPGCAVGDDFSRQLGDPEEARLAAALQFREFGSCPSPSSDSNQPRLSRLRLDEAQQVTIPRSPARENRLMLIP